MATYLFAWNPKRFRWDNLADDAKQVSQGKTIDDRWSCGNTKRIKDGDRAFLIKLGSEEPRGIFAAGYVIREPYIDIHWDTEKAEIGATALFVDVRLDVLINPYTTNIIPREMLNSPPFDSVHWGIQKSGAIIPDTIAFELEKVWSKFTTINMIALPPEEVNEAEVLYEGAAQRISVNSYERNPKARKKCIEHYGLSCKVCDFKFSELYGDVGRGFIHVHHLREISEIGEEYQIDPINDLIPVCPNCHAIIHHRKPAYKIREVQQFLQNNKSN